MVTALKEILKEAEMYSEMFPSSFSTFDRLVHEITSSLSIQFAYLSKKYEIKKTTKVVDKVSSTNIAKQLKQLSIFVVTNSQIFEFELDTEFARYDVVNITTIERIEWRVEGNVTILTLNHSVGASGMTSTLNAYNQDDVEQLQNIRDFLYEKLK
ncbi:MAG: hypothetical protein M1286_00200 [Candidatus Marsarchaeota archaeon]|jgi:hypothetical protein|nr:hypothetical protein [Candidatus Marsarchaeota archaeon]